jgi:hypothetical protein
LNRIGRRPIDPLAGELEGVVFNIEFDRFAIDSRQFCGEQKGLFRLDDVD